MGDTHEISLLGEMVSAKRALARVEGMTMSTGDRPLKIETDRPVKIETDRPLKVENVNYTPTQRPGE